jgi:hypothetical protein
MKFHILFLGYLMLHPAVHATVILTDAVGGAVPDGSLSGLNRSLVLDMPGHTITGITVNIHISGSSGGPFLGDLYAYLSDGTTLVTLMNRPGRVGGRPDGYDDNQPLDVTLSDAALTDFHTYRLAVTGNESNPLLEPLVGTFQPDGRDTSPLLVETGDARTSKLGDFDGLSAQRTFTLFVADLSAGSSHQVEGWSMTIATVPEPSSILFAGFGLFATLRRRRTS